MTIPVDVWLRGTDVAKTTTIDGPDRAAGGVDRRGRAGGPRSDAAGDAPPEASGRRSDASSRCRGLSWIVNPYEEGGVVIAIEITLGAAIAGPFDIDKAALEAMITRVLLPQGVGSSASRTVH